jgi:hypothetical protein
MSPQQIHYNGLPLSNVNGRFVNTTNSNYPGNFNSLSTENKQYGMGGISNNVAAANASKGGGTLLRQFRKKIKNITNKYKMGKGNRKSRFRSLKKKLTKFFSFGKSRKNRSRRQRGGYSQFMSNVPNTPTYSTGGVLTAANSALANPVPYNISSNNVNCVDNYSRLTNAGFPSK